MYHTISGVFFVNTTPPPPQTETCCYFLSSNVTLFLLLVMQNKVEIISKFYCTPFFIPALNNSIFSL